jgi:hypothetical protein
MTTIELLIAMGVSIAAGFLGGTLIEKATDLYTGKKFPDLGRKKKK